MKEGTPVYPARPGTVVKTEASFAKGGNDKALKDKANYVTILHDDKTLGRYLHFRKGGIVVKAGQAVKRTTLLGYSGNTGYSTAPHLHFDVYVPDKDLLPQTLKFYFSSRSGKKYTTVPGKMYRVDR